MAASGLSNGSYAASFALTRATVTAVQTAPPGRRCALRGIHKKAPREWGLGGGANSALGWGARKSALVPMNTAGGELFLGPAALDFRACH